MVGYTRDPHGAERSVMLRFNAVAYAATVFLNGSYVGSHEGASTPFVVDVTDAIRDDNRIVVVVENRRRRDRVPMSNTDWFNYGGIHRSVELLRLSASYVRDFTLALVPGSDFAKLAFSVTVGGDDGGTVRLEVPGLGIDREGNEILLNGEPVFLRGASIHEDSPANGRTLTEAEIPVYWAIDFESQATLAAATNQLTELVRRDSNRASVVIWSVGNENPDTDARLAFMETLAERTRGLDGTRLVSAACLVDHAANRIADRLADHLDVIGINEYMGWYEPGFANLPDLFENSTPDKPVIITEFGGGALAGHHRLCRAAYSKA